MKINCKKLYARVKPDWLVLAKLAEDMQPSWLIATNVLKSS